MADRDYWGEDRHTFEEETEYFLRRYEAARAERDSEEDTDVRDPE